MYVYLLLVLSKVADIALGIIPQARRILSTGGFDPIALRTLPSVNISDSSRPCVYAILYGNFGVKNFGSRSYTNAFYISQARDPYNRDAKHKQVAGTHTKSNHYRIAAAAQARAMVPILRPQIGA
jgi:hypothetical protein